MQQQSHFVYGKEQYTNRSRTTGMLLWSRCFAFLLHNNPFGEFALIGNTPVLSNNWEMSIRTYSMYVGKLVSTFLQEVSTDCSFDALAQSQTGEGRRLPYHTQRHRGSHFECGKTCASIICPSVRPREILRGGGGWWR